MGNFSFLGVFYMVFKLGHTEDIKELPFEVTGRLYDNLYEFLVVLDNEYGEGRDLDHDDGGYVLFCAPGTAVKEVKQYFDCSALSPEWVDKIDHEPEYCSALYMVKDDYAVVLLMAKNDIYDGRDSVLKKIFAAEI